MRYAVVRDGIVENVILWDGERPWQPPEGTTAVACATEVSIGWIYDGDAFQPPPDDPPV